MPLLPPNIPSQSFSIPDVNGVAPQIYSMQYIGNGEWLAFLKWETFNQNFPMAYSTKKGFIFYTQGGSNLWPTAGCFIPQLNLIAIYDTYSPSSEYSGFYSTENIINLDSIPAIPAFNLDVNPPSSFVITDNCLVYMSQSLHSFNFLTGKTVTFGRNFQTYLEYPTVFSQGKSGVVFFDDSTNLQYAPFASDLSNTIILKAYGNSGPTMAPMGGGLVIVIYSENGINYYYDLFYDGVMILSNVPTVDTGAGGAGALIGYGYILNGTNLYAILFNDVLSQADIAEGDGTSIITENYLATYGITNGTIYKLPTIHSIISRDPRLTLRNYTRRWINT
jgi:hypothetical protein